MKNTTYCNKERYKTQSFLLSLSALKCLPDISKIIIENYGDDVSMSIYKVKDNGFVIKTKKELDEKDFKKCLVKAIKKYCSSNIEKLSSILEDKYESEYDEGYVNIDLINEKFDINITKKFVYVDLDV